MAQQYPTVMIENINGKNWYYFVDSNKQEVFDKRRYEWAEGFKMYLMPHFDEYGAVQIEGNFYCIDRLGNLYQLAGSLAELNNKTWGLFLEGDVDMKTIPEEIYKYPQLQFIYIHSCNITEIKADAFSTFYQLKILSIASNVELKVDKHSFRGLENLKALSLEASITVVDKDAFKELKNLIGLQLSNCKLADFDSNSFAYCTKIKDLHIDYLIGNLNLNTEILKPLKQLVFLDITNCLTANKNYKNDLETNLKTILPNTNIRVKEFSCDTWPTYYYNKAGELYFMPAFFAVSNIDATTKVIQRVGNTTTTAYWLVELRLNKGSWADDVHIQDNGAVLILVQITNGKPKKYDVIPRPNRTSTCNTHSHNKTFYNSHYLLHESGFYQFKTIAFNVDKNQNIAEFSKHSFDGALIWKKELPLDSIYKISEKTYARQSSFLTADEAGNLYFLFMQELEDGKNYRDLAIHKNLYCFDSKTGNTLWEKEFGEKYASKVFHFMSDNNNGLYWLISDIKTNQFTLEHLNNGQISWSLAIQKKYLSPNIIYTQQQYNVDNEGNIYLLLAGREPLNIKRKGISPEFSPINLFKISPEGKVIWHQKYGKFLLPEVQEKYMAETELYYPDKDITIENNKLYIYFTSSKLRVDIFTPSLPKPNFFPDFDNEIGLSEGYDFVLVFDAKTGQLEAGQYLNE